MNFRNYDRKNLDIYLKDIFSYKIFTKEEEVSIFEEYARTKSPEVFQKIIQHNLRFVYQIAREYIDWKVLSLNDLIEEGNLGLIKSIDTFKIELGYKFITHAVQWIRRFIINALCNNKSNVRLPWNIHNESHKINKAINKETAKNGVVDLVKVSEEIELDPKTINNINKYMSHNVRFDSPVSNEDGADTVIDMYIPEKPEKDTYEIQHQREILNTIFEKMPEREVSILKAAYGIDRKFPASKDDIAKEHNLSTVRINQILEDSCILMRVIAKKRLKLETF
jgi:RNA polymerase primary sigma factor